MSRELFLCSYGYENVYGGLTDQIFYLCLMYTNYTEHVDMSKLV